MVEDLRAGRQVTDFRFDQIFPPRIRELSPIHWTPVDVAARVAKLLVRSEKTRVLDVGSGCGKLCLVGAASTPGYFIGIEQRPHFVEVARDAAKELSLERATFIPGNMTDQDWGLFDAFYLFNPFYEHLVESIQMDDTISFAEQMHADYVETVRAKLQSLRPGARVATYHGFGGEIPMGFQLLRKEPAATGFIELWLKI